MRFRLGLVAGFAAGYYMGTAAGRERHEQIRSTLEKVRRSSAFETASEKAKATIDLTVERAKDVLEEHRPGSGHAPADLVTPNATPVRV